MLRIDTKHGKPALALLVLALAGVLLAACGGSSSGSPAASTGTNTVSTSANASATVPTTSTGSTTTTPTTPTTTPTTSTTTPTTTAPGPRPQRFSALRECLQKEGITLPQRKPGQRGPGFLGAGGLPGGVSRSKFQSALTKCDSSLKLSPGQGRFFNSPATKQAYTKFAACMREHGVNLPEANTSGSGPIFDTKGINTASAAFKAAEAKCRSDLFGAFHLRPGVGAPGAAGPGAAGSTG